MRTHVLRSLRLASHVTKLALVWALALTLSACTTSTGGPAADLSLSDDPLLGKFVWHDLITDDVGRARQFYSGLLGWSFEDTTRPGGGDYTLIIANGRYMGGMVLQPDPEQGEYSRWLGYLSVADTDRAADQTRDAGGEVVAGPMDLGEVARAAAIRDPQGAVVGLLRSRMGDPVDSAAKGTGEVVWNELLSADVAESASFYSELAGLEAKTISRRGGQYTLLQAQQRDRAGILARPDEGIDPMWITHFAVPDAAAAAQRAKALGGEILLDASPEFRESSLALVTDPMGAILALHQWPEAGESQ